MRVVKSADDACYRVTWTSASLRKNKDCFDVGSASAWFGGHEEYEQHFPLDANNAREEAAFVPGDMLQDHVSCAHSFSAFYFAF